MSKWYLTDIHNAHYHTTSWYSHFRAIPLSLVARATLSNTLKHILMTWNSVYLQNEIDHEIFHFYKRDKNTLPFEKIAWLITLPCADSELQQRFLNSFWILGFLTVKNMKIKNPCNELNMQNNHWKTSVRYQTASIPKNHVVPNSSIQQNIILALFHMSFFWLFFKLFGPAMAIMIRIITTRLKHNIAADGSNTPKKNG